MKTRSKARWLGVVAALMMLAGSGVALTVRQEIKYSEDPEAAKRMTLLLRDWDPKPMVHLRAHQVQRAKYYVIDMHNHVNDPGGIHGDEVPPAEVVKAMDQANVKRVVILTGMWGDKLNRCWTRW